MRRVAATLLTFCIALTLAGCGAKPATTAQTSGPPEAHAIAAGSYVTLRNGLSLRVPAGWTATLTLDPAASGPLMANEYLLLQGLETTSGTRILMIYSSVSTSALRLSALDALGRDTFTSAGHLEGFDVFVGKPGTAYEPMRLVAAQGHTPGAELAVVFFAGDPKAPGNSLREIIDQFAIRGTPAQ